MGPTERAGRLMDGSGGRRRSTCSGAGDTCRRPLDPLGQYLPGEPFPVALPEGEDDAAAEARGFYCGTIGVEFMHIANAQKRDWIEAQMEQTAPKVDQSRVLTQLIKAEIFEQVIQSRYLGTKRFSLEGLTVLIPYLDRAFEVSAGRGRDHGGDRDEPSRTAERNDQYDRTRGEGDLYQVRGCGSALDHGRRRCEVSHGRDGRVCLEQGCEGGAAPGLEPEPPGGGGAGGDGSRTGQAGEDGRRAASARRRRHGQAAGGADRDSRRRGVRGAGRDGGAAEHGDAAWVRRGGNDPCDRQ